MRCVLTGSSAWFQQRARSLPALLALSGDKGRWESAKNHCHDPRLQSPGAWYSPKLGLSKETLLGILGGNVNLTFLLLLTIFRASSIHYHILCFMHMVPTV